MTPAMVLLMQRLSDGETVDILTSDGNKDISFQMRWVNGSLECRQFFGGYDDWGKWFSKDDARLHSLLHFANYQAPPKSQASQDSGRHIEI